MVTFLEMFIFPVRGDIQALQNVVKLSKEQGLECKEAQAKLEKTMAAKGSIDDKKVYGKLQAAKITLKQLVENHNKLHEQLRESFKRWAAQKELVDNLQKQHDELLAKQWYTKPVPQPPKKNNGGDAARFGRRPKRAMEDCGRRRK